MTKHGPVLPIWTCGGCSEPWPCYARRRELRREYAAAPIALAGLMRSYLAAASQDMSWAPAATLRRRFLGWLP